MLNTAIAIAKVSILFPSFLSIYSIAETAAEHIGYLEDLRIGRVNSIDIHQQASGLPGHWISSGNAGAGVRPYISAPRADRANASFTFGPKGAVRKKRRTDDG